MTCQESPQRGHAPPLCHDTRANECDALEGQASVEFFSNHYTKRAFTRHLPRVRTVVSTEVSIEAAHRMTTVPAIRS